MILWRHQNLRTETIAPALIAGLRAQKIDDEKIMMMIQYKGACVGREAKT